MTRMEMDDILADAFRAAVGFCPSRDNEIKDVRARRQGRARTLRNAGHSPDVIAHRLGIAVSTVRRDLTATDDAGFARHD